MTKGDALDRAIFTPDREKKIERLNSLLLEGDDMSAVIRTHIYIEHELMEFLEKTLVVPKELKPLQLDYAGRVHLAVAIGLPEELKAPLISLGTMRNAFAHRLDTKLEFESVERFYKSFSSTMKQVVQISYDRTRLKLPGTKRPKKIVSLSTRDQFTLYAVNLWARLNMENITKSPNQTS